MGLRDWLTKKAIGFQVQQANSLTIAIDKVLTQKAEELRKKGKEVNKENLMAGWKALVILGATRQIVEMQVDDYLANEKACQGK